ncbi:tetratricopeptide repeat protein [Chloroflexota bacterium]
MDKGEVSEQQSIWDDARKHIERGDYDKAIEIYSYVLIRYADDLKSVEYANAYLGDIFLTTQRLDLAEQHLIKAITLAPKNAHYHYLLGFTYSVGERWAKSVASFRKAIRLESDNGEFERGLGWAVLNSGKKMDGITHLYRAVELSPSNVHAVTDLATAFLMLGNLGKASEYGEQAIQLDPSNSLVLNLLETIERIKGNLV